MPAHVKGYISNHVAALKLDVEQQMIELARPGRPVADASVCSAERGVLGAERLLDEGQRAAAAALAGTDRLVTVIGPTGTGKTTMLRVACALLKKDGRRPVVLAPTRKAAQVVGSETGADGLSVHELLRAHGWTWAADETGRENWHQEQLPRLVERRFRIRPNDRIVVDEAGMLDLESARALCTTAKQTGAGLAFVGDPLQLRPVGHSGAMLLADQAATARVRLEDVHRFRTADGDIDDAYARLTIDLRDTRTPEQRLAIADRLINGGHVIELDDGVDPAAYLAERYLEDTAYGATVSLVTATNEEAQRINDTIQRLRLARGELLSARVVEGMEAQPVYEGDVVQSRANEAGLGVSNRELWRVRDIGRDGVSLACVSDTRRTRLVPATYVAEHVHLAYASTAHGVQGETSDRSYTSGAVSGPAIDVGLTRGRHRNTLVLPKSAFPLREQIAEMLTLGPIESSIGSTRAAAVLDLERAACASQAELLSR